MKPRWRNGRRAGLKNLWGLKPHVGPTPTLGTHFCQKKPSFWKLLDLLVKHSPFGGVCLTTFWV